MTALRARTPGLWTPFDTPSVPLELSDDSINRGLVSWWPLVGGRTHDLTGQNNGTPNGTGQTYPSSVAGRVLTFPSSQNSGFINVGTNIGSAATTICAWISATSVSATWNSIITRESSTLDGASLYVKSTRKLSMFVGISGATDVSYDGTGANTLLLNTPYFVACTYDSVSGMVGYLNAGVDALATANGAITNFGSSFPTYIGNDFQVPASRQFQGSIWNARIYNRALTADEIRRLYREPWAGARTRSRSAQKVVAVSASLDPSLSCVATLTVALSTSLPVSSSMAATASTTASVSTSIPVASSMSSVASVSPELSTSLPVSSSMSSVTSLSPSVNTSIPITPSLSAATSMASELSTSVPVSATLSATASMSPSVDTSISIAPFLSATSSLSPDVLTDIRVQGSLSANSSLSTSISTLILLSSSMSSSSSLQGALSTLIQIAASPSAIATLNAIVSSSATDVAASLQSSATLFADLLTSIAAAASLSSSSTLSPSLFTTKPMACSLSSASTLLGSLSSSIQMSSLMVSGTSLSPDILTAISLMSSLVGFGSELDADLLTQVLMDVNLSVDSTLTTEFLALLLPPDPRNKIRIVLGNRKFILPRDTRKSKLT